MRVDGDARPRQRRRALAGRARRPARAPPDAPRRARARAPVARSTDKELTIAWAQSADFYRRKAEEPACREQIADAIRTVTGSSLRLAYALADEHELPQAAAAPTLSDDELIDRFMREFDAEELPAEEES